MRIKSIKKLPYKGAVYNLAVKEDETFFADNILVHNCRSMLNPVFITDIDDPNSYYYEYDKKMPMWGTNISANAAQPAVGFGGV